MPSKRTGDFAVAEVGHIVGHYIGEIGISLNAVEKFSIAVAVKCARLVGDAGRRLTLFPLTPVHHQHLVVAVVLDAPDANDAYERFRLGADRLVREVELQGLCCVGACHTSTARPTVAMVIVVVRLLVSILDLLFDQVCSLRRAAGPTTRRERSAAARQARQMSLTNSPTRSLTFLLPACACFFGKPPRYFRLTSPARGYFNTCEV
jgi:hypothetical protein